MNKSTIVAISTAVGNAAIGVVRLSGDSSHAIVAEMFKPKNPATPKGYEARFGILYDKMGPIDEVVALYFYAPNSYTGENLVELSCHGNPTLLRRVVAAAVSLGACPAAAGEFSRRALENGKLTLAKAEAVGALIAGEGRRATAAASDALCGVLGRQMTRLADDLCRVSATVVVACDYPEDTDLDTAQIIADILPLRSELLRLADNSELVISLNSGIETVIVGRPNVGKSTILNLLCGFDRAIVSPVAGTTRDIVEQRVELLDYHLIIRDTAGIHNTDDDIEREGIRRSRLGIETAQLIIAVLEKGEAVDEELLCMIEGKRAIIVLNKSDMAPTGCESVPLAHPNVELSAINPDHRERLVEAILRVLPNIEQGATLLPTTRQAVSARAAADGLTRALENLEQGIIDVCSVNLEEAYRAVCDILLLNATDEMIDAIFENFCIGK